MPKVDVVAQQEDEEQLADVLLLAVAVQSLVALELGADVGQLLINPLDLCLLAFTWCHTNRLSALGLTSVWDQGLGTKDHRPWSRHQGPAPGGCWSFHFEQNHLDHQDSQMRSCQNKD